jgi:hypothetical protein
MAVGVQTSGSNILLQLPGAMMETVQLTTSANGEDAMTFISKIEHIRTAFITGNEDTKGGAFTASWSGTTVTIKSVAGATGDACLVSLMVIGY